VLALAAPEGSHPLPEGEEQPAGGFTSVVRRVFGGDNNAIIVKGYGDLLVYRAKSL
jgi:hypothetical protein